MGKIACNRLVNNPTMATTPPWQGIVHSFYIACQVISMWVGVLKYVESYTTSVYISTVGLHTLQPASKQLLVHGYTAVASLKEGTSSSHFF